MQKVAIICEREDFKDLEEMNTLVNCIMQSPEYAITNDYEEADLIIISCAAWGTRKVIDIQVIADVLYNKKETASIIVTGELAQRKVHLKKELPYVEVQTLKELYTFFGGVPEALKRYIPHNAVVISTGCNHSCSYCLYSQMEHPYISKSKEQILQEVAEMYDREVLIHITGALETGDYGMDWHGDRMLAALLKRICTQFPNCEYSIKNLHPDGLTNELIQVISKNHNISYLEIYLEHTDYGILQKMNRPPAENIMQKLQKLQQIRPDLNISTNIIIGFPGESELSHKKLCKSLQSIRWEHIAIYEYEKIAGTPSARIFEKMQTGIVEERKNELIEKLAMQTGQFYIIPFSIETQYPITAVYESACISLDQWSDNIFTAKCRQKHDYIAGTDTASKINQKWLDIAEQLGEQIIEIRDVYMQTLARNMMQETYTLPYRTLVQELIESVETKPTLHEKARYILLE